MGPALALPTLGLAALLAGQAPSAAAADDPAARAAVGAFAFGCLERLAFAASAADYAAKSTALGDQLAGQLPPESRDRFKLEGEGGDACRVTYRGPAAESLWIALTDFKASKTNNPCKEMRTANRAALTCGASENPAYDEVVERSGAGAQAQVTASLIFRGRAAVAPGAASPPSGSAAHPPAGA